MRKRAGKNLERWTPFYICLFIEARPLSDILDLTVLFHPDQYFPQSLLYHFLHFKKLLGSSLLSSTMNGIC